MTTAMRAFRSIIALMALSLAARAARADLLTADQAVQLALQHGPDVQLAGANVLDAKSGLYGAYSGVLPHVTASVSRSNNVINGTRSPGRVGGAISPYDIITDSESHGTTPGVSGSWSLVNLSNLEGLSAARTTLKAATHQLASSRNDIAYGTRRQFYEVVKAIHLAHVAASSLQLSRDDERRVRALFEVGSVSRSDLLKAEVRTAQSQLDSLTSDHQITVQRDLLASQIGVPESQMGEVDTVLTSLVREFDENALVNEASSKRPDIMAAEAELAAARSSKWSARLARFPYLTVSGSYDWNLTSRQTYTVEPPGFVPFYAAGVTGADSKTDKQMALQVALNWDIVDGLSADARNAAATARMSRAQTNRDQLHRNLVSEIHETLLLYRAAVVGLEVAQRAEESALESVKLTQQKYNVGSSTILDLIDAQVQLQRAQSDRVSAAAAIRVAEAQVDKVRGKQE
jgi:outer membrane protein TolC